MRLAVLLSLLLLLPLTVLALAPEQREQCKHQIGGMKGEHLRLARKSQQLKQGSAHLESLERGIEAAQAVLAQDRAELQSLRESLESKAGKSAAAAELGDGAAKEFGQYANDIHRFRQAREAFARKLQDYNERVRAQQARRERYNREAQELNQNLVQYEERAKEINLRCTRDPLP